MNEKLKCNHQQNSSVNWLLDYEYHKVSNIERTQFQTLSDSRPALQLSLPNVLKPCIKSRMKM